MRKLLLTVLSFVLSVSFAFGQSTHKIPPGSKVFIAPMNGFESYLMAAFSKKQVPVTLVGSKEAADFVVTGDANTQKAGWAKTLAGNIHSDEEASITVMDSKTDEIVFAYAVNKKNTLHGKQTAAEACAKHLKDQIEGK